MKSFVLLSLAVLIPAVGQAVTVNTAKSANVGSVPQIGAVGVGVTPVAQTMTQFAAPTTLSAPLVPVLAAPTVSAKPIATATPAKPKRASLPAASQALAKGVVGTNISALANAMDSSQIAAEVELSPVYDNALPVAEQTSVVASPSKSRTVLGRAKVPSLAAKTNMTLAALAAMNTPAFAAGSAVQGSPTLFAWPLMTLMFLSAPASIMAITAAVASGLTIAGMFPTINKALSDPNSDWGVAKANTAFQILFPSAVGFLFGGIASAFAVPAGAVAVQIAALAVAAILAVAAPTLYIVLGKKMQSPIDVGAERGVIAAAVSIAAAATLMAANYYIAAWAALPLTALVLLAGAAIAGRPLLTVDEGGDA